MIFTRKGLLTKLLVQVLLMKNASKYENELTGTEMMSNTELYNARLKLEKLETELAELRAEKLAREGQKPGGWLIDGVPFYLVRQLERSTHRPFPNQQPLYLAAGTKP